MAVLSGIHLEISLAGRRVNRCPECIITSSRRAVLTNGRITIPDPTGDVQRGLAHGQSLSILFGHRDQQPEVFSGTVSRWHPSPTARDQVVVHAMGPEKPLFFTRMTESWFEEPAPILARRILAASGLPVGRVDLPEEVIPRMTVSGWPLRDAVMALMKTLEDGFAHKLSHYSLRMEGGALVLDGNAVDGLKPIIATGAGIIRNNTGKGSLNEVETYLTPYMRAGMQFTLGDIRKGVEGVLMADAVTHAIRPKAVRTFIYYGGTYERFQC